MLENQQASAQLFGAASSYYQSSEIRLPEDVSETVGFPKQNNLEKWDSIGSLKGLQLDSEFLNPDSAVIENDPSAQELFCIVDISPAWGYSTEETKVLYRNRIFLHCIILLKC